MKKMQQGVSMGGMIVFLILGLLVVIAAVKVTPGLLRYHQMRVVADEIKKQNHPTIEAARQAYDLRVISINKEETLDARSEMNFFKAPDNPNGIDMSFDYEFLIFRIDNMLDLKFRFVYSTATGGYVYPEAPQPAPAK